MMALDSSLFIGASTGEVGVDVIAVARPDRSENILRYLERLAHWESSSADRNVQKQIAVRLAGRASGG
ncbi:hypothetical protein PV350_08595 [Streptomyces sp. PA03-6a]|nr:hypothetical protein [Streptomyces sp. PA03-6a]